MREILFRGFHPCDRKSPVCYDSEWQRFCVWLNGAESMGVNKHLSTAGVEVIGTVFDEVTP